eukprot:TRINITY_DN6819_c0_g1_i1.p1 TRINITY_DN6819_c0_g1~~TRINITY_DN6819_c0_g1_i1.p1  ORF type:complete len:355 (-),score=108.60 TRINITY_DN6819_c0_g1_i1:105-1169(-)
MQAIYQTESGDTSVLQFGAVEKPSLRNRDVLVRVHAVGINPVDAKRRASVIKAGHKLILGFDASGVVEAVGPEVSLFQCGDEVYFAGDNTRDGANAEYVAVDERIVGRKPKSLPHELAAGMALVSLTSWEALFELLHVPHSDTPTGKSLLMVGGAGGLGSIAVQLAKRLAGLTVYATAGRPESAAFVRELGADHVIDYTKDLAGQIEGGSVDYVFSAMPPEDNFEQLAALVKPFGGLAFALYPNRPLDCGQLFVKRATLGFERVFLRASTGIDAEKQGEILKRVAQLLDAGVLRHTVRNVYDDWSHIRAAHAQIKTGHTIGKITLKLAQAWGAMRVNLYCTKPCDMCRKENVVV